MKWKVQEIKPWTVKEMDFVRKQAAYMESAEGQKKLRAIARFNRMREKGMFGG